MLIVGAYAVYWRFAVFLIGAVTLYLAAINETDLGVFPYIFIIFSVLSMSDKHKRAGDNIRRTITRPDDATDSGVRATCSVMGTSSMLLLIAGLAGFAWAALQLSSILSPFLDLNISFLLILLSTVEMFFLESVAIRYGWFQGKR